MLLAERGAAEIEHVGVWADGRHHPHGVAPGAVGHVVDVQVDLSDGMIGTALVGRPDTSITEARDRCRAAIIDSGFAWPKTRRITVLLSPADLPKRGPHFDLAIAIAVLAATDKDSRASAGRARP